MKTIKSFAIAIMALTILACSQSKEDKFLADLEDFVETFENSSYDYLKDNFESMANTFFSKVENLYGVDLSKSDHIMECLEASGLNLNDKQKEKAYELEERLKKRFADLKEEKKQMRETKREERKRQESIEKDLDDNEITSSDSEDWDALLNSYEEYVDKYISYFKKAAKGDANALSEYPALMKKAEDFSDKMKNAESSMSASQWARYNKITMKMLEAAKEMDD